MSIGNTISKVLNENGIATSTDHWWGSRVHGKNVIFIGSVLKQCAEYLWRFDRSTNIVFYGAVEGQPVLTNFDKVALKRSNVKMVVPSIFCKEMLESIDVPVEAVIPHAIFMNEKDHNEEFEKNIRSSILGGGDFKVILNISDNNSRKGLQKFMVASKIIERMNPETFFFLHSQAGVGYGGINLQKYKQIIENKRLWHTGLGGQLSEPKVNSLYNISYFYSSSSFAEGFGLPMIESFRFNRPVVAVDAKPFNEIVENGKTGILFPYEKRSIYTIQRLMNAVMHIYSVDDFVDAMTLLLMDEKRYRSMSENIEKEKWKWHAPNVYKAFIPLLQ